ncbi:MAG TPA: hypothetical protein VHT97_06345, partial [Acidimicrobiales bacterium]|nr:hypothetical protein [Acidimicrobiales bacterium]
MRRLPVRRGWALAATAVLILVGAGAIVSGTGTKRSTVAGTSAGLAAGPTSSSSDAIAPATGLASGAPANGGGGDKAQVAPGPVPLPPAPGSTAVVPGSPRIVRTADLRVKVVKGGFASAFDRV